ncbi:MAG: ROK family protein [Armatimonadetes bacterium]|nr:ROK family protein [Armatimonadota bacterium]MDE2207252.1 ROK family protein [Armatimonadota bacterium]
MTTSGLLLGVDIGGTKCAVSLAEPDGTIIGRHEEPTEEGIRSPGQTLAALATAGKGLLNAAGAGARPAGIGVSCGGPLDADSGIIMAPPNLPSWTAVPVKRLLEEAFDAPVVVERDANAAALAEFRLGAGRGCRQLIYVTMGTGIGAGIIVDGKLLRGVSGMAGELGHTTILPDGPLCRCGKRGCLEALASGPAIARLAVDRLAYGRGRLLLQRAGGVAAAITAQHVIEAARSDDAFSQDVLSEAGHYMGIGLANAIQALNPERIILGTIAVHAQELILDPIRASVFAHAWARAATGCEIVPAGLGDRAQDMAAIALVMAPL